jgi:ABC-type multidrug transport system fused ATPase/permease subunit
MMVPWPWLSRSSSPTNSSTASSASSTTDETDEAKVEESDDENRHHHHHRGNLEPVAEVVHEDESLRRGGGHSDRLSPRGLLVEQVRENSALIALGTLALVASSFTNQAVPRLLGRIIDGAGGNNRGDRRGCATDAAAPSLTRYYLVAVVVGGGLASGTRTALLRWAQSGIAGRLRLRALEAIFVASRDGEWLNVRRRSAEIEQNKRQKEEEEEEKEQQQPEMDERPKDRTTSTTISTTPESISTILSSDVEQISEAVTTTLANLVRSSFSVALSAASMARIDPVLLLGSAALVPVVGAAAIAGHKRLQAQSRRRRCLQDACRDHASERLHNLPTVRLCWRERDELDACARMQSELADLDRRVALSAGCFMGGMFAAGSAGLASVVALGASRMNRPGGGGISHGQLASFATYSFLLGLGTSGCLKALSELRAGMDAADRYCQLLRMPLLSQSRPVREEERDDAEEEEEDGDGSGTDLLSRISWIALESVSFAYRQPPEEGLDACAKTLVLRDVSLVLERGTVTACVGPNGAGKSTLVNLLSGMIEPTQGRVVASTGHELSQLLRRHRGGRAISGDKEDKGHNRHLVQVVPQSVSSGLMDISILDNVRYAVPKATEEQARQALLEAGCSDDWVSSFPSGLEYRVGRAGSKLSGGQAQRIALARALLADPVLLILDEPSSHLDASGEAALAAAVVRSCTHRNNEQASAEVVVDGTSTPSPYRRHDRAVLLVTHNPKTLEWADRVVVMDDGCIVESGTLQELRERPGSRLVQLMPDVLLT